VDNLDELLDALKVNCYPLRIECAHRMDIEGDTTYAGSLAVNGSVKDLFGRSVPAGEYFKVDISIMVSTQEHDEIKT